MGQKAADYLKKPFESLKMITCHLGNGASITAIDSGRSVDTSMGFTPLEGLVMGTRCGDIDPALVTYIMSHEKLSSVQMDAIMNKNSGMLGLTGTSNDMREIMDEADRGSAQHQLALEIYCNRIKKYIGSYIAEMGGVDVIVFTGGIGENAPFVRENSLSSLEIFSIGVDSRKNESRQTDIGTGDVSILVIPTNEELAIARDTKKILVLGNPLEDKPVRPSDAKTAFEPLFVDHEKADLVLLWAEEPGASVMTLAKRLSKKLGKSFSATVIRQELEHLGLHLSS